MITVKVIGQQATLSSKEDIVSGAVNFIPVSVSFDSSWNGLTKYCQFSKDTISIDVLISSSVICFPHEVLTGDNGYVYLKFWGEQLNSEGTVIAKKATSNPLGYYMVSSNLVSPADVTNPPTPDVYSQVVYLMDKQSVDALAAQAAQEAAEIAQGKAETAQQGAEAAQQLAETAKAGADSAKNAALTSQNDASNSAGNAALSEQKAKDSETNSALSESNAAQSAIIATTQATNASNSATSAQASATAANSSRVESQNARDGAETARVTSVSSANAASINKDITDDNVDITALLKSQVEALKAEVLAAEERIQQAENRVIALMATDTKSYFFNTLADRDAFEGLRHCDRCSVLETKTDYIYDTHDTDGDGVNPEWTVTSSWDALKTVAWEIISGKPNFASVATSGSYVDLSDTPNRYESIIIVSDGNWNYLLSDKILLVTTNLVEITNVTNGSIGIINTDFDLTLPPNSKKSLDYNYVTALAGESYQYTFLYDGSYYLWSRTVIQSAE